MSKPNFLIVGAAKSGTTSLSAYLRQHPQVFLSKWKEPGFFSPQLPDRPKSEAEYFGLFQGATNQQAIGEASTAYLFDEEAPRKIKETLSPIKIIILLRNPVDAMFSLWAHNRREGIERRPFRLALEINAPPPDVPSNIPALRFRYWDRYRYAEQVERYQRCFTKEEVYIAIFEEFFEDIALGFEGVCRFLGVSEKVKIDFDIHNAGGGGHALTQWVFRNRRWLRYVIRPFTSKAMRLTLVEQLRSLSNGGDKGQLDSSTRAELVQLVAPDVALLEERLGRSIPAWRY